MRCQGRVRVWYWNLRHDPLAFLETSLAELRARGLSPDAVIYEMGVHYAPHDLHPHLLKNSPNPFGKFGGHVPNPIDVFGAAVEQATVDVATLVDKRRAVFFGLSSSVPAMKLEQFWKDQNECQTAKMNAFAMSIAHKNGMPAFDTFSFTKNVPGEYSLDGTHWKGEVLIAKGHLLVEALTWDSTVVQTVDFEEPRAVMTQCALEILAVDMVPVNNKTGFVPAPPGHAESWRPWVQAACAKETEQQFMAACHLKKPVEWQSVDTTITFRCRDCPTWCGEDGGHCGAQPTQIKVPSGVDGKAEYLILMYCPAWQGGACSAHGENVDVERRRRGLVLRGGRR